MSWARHPHLAASTLETAVAQALERLLAAGTVPTAEAVRAWVAPERPEIPALAIGVVDLATYDDLLTPAIEWGMTGAPRAGLEMKLRLLKLPSFHGAP